MTEVRRLLTQRARTRPLEPAFLSAADGRILTWRSVLRAALDLR